MTTVAVDDGFPLSLLIPFPCPQATGSKPSAAWKTSAL